MDTLACIKRVPDTGAKIVLTDDQQGIDASNLGFTMSPHEECAIEAAVRTVETHGGSATALTLGPPAADEQLRTALAMKADDAILLDGGDDEWGPTTTARAIADAVRERGEAGDGFDLLFFGNESADAENYQVGVRVADELDLPVVTGVKSLEVEADAVTAMREVPGGEEVYEVDLPAVLTVKEGLNEPRYPSMRSKMQARRQEVDVVEPERRDGDGGLETVRLEAPEAEEGEAEVLGEGPAAVDRIVEVLADEVEVL